MIISININNGSSAHIIMMFLAAGETVKAARCVCAAGVTGGVAVSCVNHQHRLHQQPSAAEEPGPSPVRSSLFHLPTMEIGHVAVPVLPGFISNQGGKNANIRLKEDYPAPTSVHQRFCSIFHLWGRSCSVSGSLAPPGRPSAL